MGNFTPLLLLLLNVNCGLFSDQVPLGFYQDLIVNFQIRDVNFILDDESSLHELTRRFTKEMSRKNVLTSVRSFEIITNRTGLENHESCLIILSELKSEEIIEQVVNLSQSQDLSTWIFSPDIKTIKNSNVRIRFDSDIYLFQPVDDQIQLYEIYQKGKDSPRIVEMIGTWNEEGVKIPNSEKWNRRSDLTGVHLRLGSIQVIAYTFIAINNNFIIARGPLSNIKNL